jgi:hypothetical protein
MVLVIIGLWGYNVIGGYNGIGYIVGWRIFRVG